MRRLVDGQRQGDPARAPAAVPVEPCRGGGAPDGMIDVSADTLVGGVTLAERMIVGSAKLGEAGSGHEDRAWFGRRHGNSGRTLLHADDASLATGINPPAAIAFQSPTATGVNCCVGDRSYRRVRLIWAKAEGVPVGGAEPAAMDGIEWMLSSA